MWADIVAYCHVSHNPNRNPVAHILLGIDFARGFWDNHPMHTKTIIAAACAAVVVPLMAADASSSDKALAGKVLHGGPRTTYRVIQHEIEIADRAADAAWLGLETPAQLKAHQRTLHTGMTASIGGLPKRTPLNAKVLRKHAKDGYSIEEILFESHPGIHVTALLFLPDPAKYQAPYPGVIVTCGHSGNGKAYAGYQRTSLLLAKAGMAALIYDPFDQGERIQQKGLSNCHGHNTIGVNATLLGWSMARFRIWDGMRAIDYLQSRDEVDPERIGVCGQSGGGTMTSLIMAIEPRIRCAAPSCYLSTLRDVYGEIGPQDAEQNLFGQLSFGLNHLGYALLQAPTPVLMNFKTADFFPFQGALQTAANAKAVAARFGWADRFNHVYGVGPHGWSEGNRRATVDWMRQWLRGEKGVWDASGDSYRALDIGFDLKEVDCGIPEKEVAVAPEGSVLNLPGERTVYDLFREELAAAGSVPKKVSPDVVATRAGIRPQAEASFVPTMLSHEKTTGGSLEKMVFVSSDSLALPAVLLSPDEKKGAPALLLADDGRGVQAARARELFAAGIPVMLLDVAGTGEIAVSPHKFYGASNPDEEVAVMLYTLGRSLVGMRAEEIAFVAGWLANRFGGKTDIVADGRVCVAAHHARGAYPALIGNIVDSNAPLSWRDVIAQGARYPFACAVVGGLRDYDWTDL